MHSYKKYNNNLICIYSNPTPSLLFAFFFGSTVDCALILLAVTILKFKNKVGRCLRGPSNQASISHLLLSTRLDNISFCQSCVWRFLLFFFFLLFSEVQSFITALMNVTWSSALHTALCAFAYFSLFCKNIKIIFACFKNYPN